MKLEYLAYGKPKGTVSLQGGILEYSTKAARMFIQEQLQDKFPSENELQKLVEKGGTYFRLRRIS